MTEEEDIRNHPLFENFEKKMKKHDLPMDNLNEWRFYWYCWIDGWRSAKLSSGELNTIIKRGW